jgi:hypothetical protein
MPGKKVQGQNLRPAKPLRRDAARRVSTEIIGFRARGHGL